MIEPHKVVICKIKCVDYIIKLNISLSFFVIRSNTDRHKDVCTALSEEDIRISSSRTSGCLLSGTFLSVLMSQFVSDDRKQSLKNNYVFLFVYLVCFLSS